MLLVNIIILIRKTRNAYIGLGIDHSRDRSMRVLLVSKWILGKSSWNVWI